jgi:ion channel-forming bestrophin family protein
MHTGKKYNIFGAIIWSKREILYSAIIASLVTVSVFLFKCDWLTLPWVSVSLVGTVLAFTIGFRNTQTYNRTWEARQIYGSIVNCSRSFAVAIKNMVEDPSAHQTLVYRHFAWLTALRFQLREFREWESTEIRENVKFRKSSFSDIPERVDNLKDDLEKYLSENEVEELLKTKNRATQILSKQAEAFKVLMNQERINPLFFVELMNHLKDLYEYQGKAERIKNFPYPRQFATINLVLVRIFTVMLPIGLVHEFLKIGDQYIWLNIPVSVLVSWIYILLEKVGVSTENPFEGGPNDVPITALSRTIEIDLREILGETELPAPIKPVKEILL